VLLRLDGLKTGRRRKAAPAKPLANSDRVRGSGTSDGGSLTAILSNSNEFARRGEEHLLILSLGSKVK